MPRDPHSKLVTVESPPLVLSTGGRSGLALAISAEAPNVVQVRGSGVPYLCGAWGAGGVSRSRDMQAANGHAVASYGNTAYELASALG